MLMSGLSNGYINVKEVHLFMPCNEVVGVGLSLSRSSFSKSAMHGQKHEKFN